MGNSPTSNVAKVQAQPKEQAKTENADRTFDQVSNGILSVWKENRFIGFGIYVKIKFVSRNEEVFGFITSSQVISSVDDDDDLVKIKFQMSGGQGIQPKDGRHLLIDQLGVTFIEADKESQNIAQKGGIKLLNQSQAQLNQTIIIPDSTLYEKHISKSRYRMGIIKSLQDNEVITNIEFNQYQNGAPLIDLQENVVAVQVGENMNTKQSKAIKMNLVIEAIKELFPTDSSSTGVLPYFAGGETKKPKKKFRGMALKMMSVAYFQSPFELQDEIRGPPQETFEHAQINDPSKASEVPTNDGKSLNESEAYKERKPGNFIKF